MSQKAESAKHSYLDIDDDTRIKGPFEVIKTDIRADGRGRVTLGAEVVGNTQYRALMNQLGQIVLDPVVTIPAQEFWLWQNPVALASVVRGVNQAKRGELGTFPSFSGYVDQSEEGDEAGGAEGPVTSVPSKPGKS